MSFLDDPWLKLSYFKSVLFISSRTNISGPIAGSLGVLNLPSLSFVAVDKLYEIVVEVRKFTMMGSYNYSRVTPKRLQVLRQLETKPLS